MTSVPSAGGHRPPIGVRRHRQPHRPPPDDLSGLVRFRALVQDDPWQPRPRIHTAMIAVDICAFGDPSRDDVTQLQLRAQMYGQLARTCVEAGLPWDLCYREDRGDGVLVITPSDVPIETLLEPFGDRLDAALRTYNRHASQAARLRIRVAAHTGLINRDDFGVTGQALVHVFRLLEAEAFKSALAESGADLGLIVSDRLHGDAVSQGGGLGGYRKIHISCKETRIDAWVRFPT